MRRSVRTARALALAGALLLPGCSGGGTDEDGPVRGMPDGEVSRVTNTNAEGSTSWYYGSWTACVNAGTAVIESLEPLHMLGTIVVERVGVKPYEHGVAAWKGQLPSDYRPVNGFELSARCSGPERAEFAVQLRRDGAGPGAVDGLVLRYHVGNRSYTSVWAGVQIVLCDPADKTRHPSGLFVDCAT